MCSRQQWFFWIVVITTVNLFGFVHAQEKVLQDAPKQLRFYANHLASNFEKVQTLKGELISDFRRPVSSATFYHDRGHQQGIEEVTVPGDFIKEDSEAYTFTWDLASDNLVSMGIPSDKPCRYLDAKTNREFVPERKNNLFGVEKDVAINSHWLISTSRGEVTSDGEHRVYERTQNNTHQMRGSPKQVLSWQHDLTHHELLLAVSEQLQDTEEATRDCYLSIEDDLHTLDLIVTKKNGDLLTTKWVFDAANDFVLKVYECEISETNTLITDEWTYSQSEFGFPVATQMTKTVLVDGQLDNSAAHSLTNLVVNDELAPGTFTLASLEPANGDILIDQETQERFVIRDQGEQLVSLDLPTGPSHSSRSTLIAINFVLFAFVIVLLIFIRRQKGTSETPDNSHE